MKKFLLILIFFSGIALVLPAKAKAGHVGGVHVSCPGGTTEVRSYGECCGCGKAKEVVVCADAQGKEGYYWGDCVHKEDSCTNGCPTPGKPPRDKDCAGKENEMLNECVRVDCDGKNWMKVEKWCDGSGFSYEKPGRSTGVSCSGPSKKSNPGCSAPDEGTKPSLSCPGACLKVAECPEGSGAAPPQEGWLESECNKEGNVCCTPNPLYCEETWGGICTNTNGECPLKGTGNRPAEGQRFADCPTDKQLCCIPPMGICKYNDQSKPTYRDCAPNASYCPGSVVATGTKWNDCPNQACCEYTRTSPKKLGEACNKELGGYACEGFPDTDCIFEKCRAISEKVADCGRTQLTDTEYLTCKTGVLGEGEDPNGGLCCPANRQEKDQCYAFCFSQQTGTKELGESCTKGSDCKNYSAGIDCIGNKCMQVDKALGECGKPHVDGNTYYTCDDNLGLEAVGGVCCHSGVDCKASCAGRNVPPPTKKTCAELCGADGGECLASDRGYRFENNSCVNDVNAGEPTSDCTDGKSCYCRGSVPCAGIDQSNNPDCKRVCARSQTTAASRTGELQEVESPADTLSTFSGHGEASSPVKNAKITLKDPDGKKFVVKTDENGDYTITVPTDRVYNVTIESSGYKTLAFKWESKMGLDYLMNFKLVKKDKAENGNFEIEEATKDRLLVGWNLISLPVKPKTQMKASGLLVEINRSGGLVVSVSRWQDGRWETYLAGLDKNDFAIEVGRAYFVENFNEAQFKIEGEEITQPQTLYLKPGWNAIGLPKTASCPASSCSAKVVMNLIDKQSADSARIFGQFESGLWGTLAKEGQQFYGWDFVIKSNAGYFVKVNKPIQLLP